MQVPISRQVECVERELKFRRRVYAHRVATDKMTQRKADDEIAAMEAVLATLQGIAERGEAAVSTQSDSVIRKSRALRHCARCEGAIRPSDRYLSYAPGQRMRIPYCLDCARAVHADLIAVAYMDAPA